MKKVLVILYYWPPGGGMAVQRWLKFSKYLPEFGWEPVIYAPENADYPEIDESLTGQVPEGITILKRPIFEPSRLYGKFVGMKKTEKIGVSFSLGKKPSRLARLKNGLSLWVRGNLFIPDAHVCWVRPSVRFLTRYLRQNPVDAIVTTGTPHSLHLIGLKLRKRFDIPWIADFRDLWTRIDFYRDLKLTRRADRIHHRMERRVLSGADHIVTVGETWRKEFLENGAGAVTVITNGYDPEDVPMERPPLDKKFSLVHIGSIGKNRDARALWEALAEKAGNDRVFAEKFELRLVGNVDFSVMDSIREAGLEDYTVRIDFLSHDEAMKAQQSAAVLLLLINNSDDARGRLTGKIFEYLAAGRPVIAIGPADGEAAMLLESTGAGKTASYDDKKEMATIIERFFNDFINENLHNIKTDTRAFSRQELSRKMAGLLEMLTARKKA
jgi:glycosyltransferase involved in cell wall biosynthesis